MTPKIRIIQRLLIFFALLCALTALPGCGSREPGVCTVTYTYEGEVLQELQLTRGEALPAYTPEIPGMRFVSWMDKGGSLVEPEGSAVNTDTVYSAYALPWFGSHEAYLFADDAGFIHPDTLLSRDDFSLAVTNLLPPEAEGLALTLPEGEDPVILSEIGRTLSLFYTEDELAAFSGDEAITRGEFAAALNLLIGRGAAERVNPAPAAQAPVDAAGAYYADILEAAVPHTVSEEGQTWEQAQVSTGYEAGMFNRDGYLYCCDEKGQLLKAAYVGPLYFGPDGQYTSGDAELDAYVAAILSQLREENPSSREEMLRQIYVYVKNSFRYLGRNHYEEGATGWEIDDAKVMFETGLGNCYNFAGAFWALARGLGYPAVTICKPLDNIGGVHGWTEIEIDGIPYIFDPQLEMNFGNDRFMLTYEEGAGYGYRRPVSPEELRNEAYEDMVYEEPVELGEVVSATGEDGSVYLVYLPYGYDENEQYRVLLYLNGADGDPYKMLGTAYQYSHGNYYFCTGITTKSYLDFLIERGYCEPIIVVSTNTTLGRSSIGRYLSLIQYTVDNFSTYAESSSVEDLVAAREYFAIAGPSTASQSICVSIQELPDIFAYYGLFSGMYDAENTLACFRQKQDISYLVMAAGDRDYQMPVMEDAYEIYSQLDNVKDSTLMIVKNCDHDWTAFDGAIRELLFHFAPYGEG